MKRYILSIIFLLCTLNNYGTIFTWTGSVDTVFTNSSNWSSSGSPGYPSSSDTAIISNTATNRPVLSANQDVYYLQLGSGTTLDLKNYTFTAQDYADIRGTVNNGTLALRGQSAIIKSTAYINSILDIEAYSIELDGGTYMKRCLIEKVGTGTCSGDGGCIFNDEVTIINSSSSGASIKLSTVNGDVFNHDLLLYVQNRGAIYLSDADTSYFNGDIYVNNEGSMSIIFGDGGGVSYLDDDNVIIVGDSGYVANGLYLSNFIQEGTTEQNLTLSGTSSLFLSNCEINAVSTFESPDILVSTSAFNDSTTLIKSSGGTNNWYGENIFNGPINIFNQSGYNLRLSNVIGNIFNGNAVFNTESAIIDVDYTDTTEFRANLQINSSDVMFRNCIIFNGTDDQFVDGDEGYRFKELTINKPGTYVEIDTSIFISDTLKLTSGYIYGDSTGIVIMDSLSTYSGGGRSSYVNCQMKKIGNTSFVFPLGQDSIFRLY